MKEGFYKTKIRLTNKLWSDYNIEKIGDNIDNWKFGRSFNGLIIFMFEGLKKEVEYDNERRPGP